MGIKTEDQQKEIARLPKWVTTDRYSIEARAADNPTKDQFRLILQSLLADRHQLFSMLSLTKATSNGIFPPALVCQSGVS